MSTLDDIQTLFPAGPDAPRPGAAPAKRCRKHFWVQWGGGISECSRCHKVKDPAVSRRSKNNRKRGTSDELTVARILGGSKVGPLGLPWDVIVDGYLRAQCKKTVRWPSLNDVVRWLDAIPAGPELRAVTLADAPGHGRVRRLIVLDLDEFARWHGRSET